MQVISLTEARNNLKAVFDAVYNNHDEVIIHRKGRENVVVIPFDEYNAMKETIYLLSSKNNRDRLNDAVDQIESMKYTKRDIEI